MDKFDMSQLKPLCRGNRTDRGWTQDEAGRWTPSVFDRRRVAVSMITMLAEQQGGNVAGMQIAGALRAHSTSHEDFEAMAQNFNDWQRSVSQ